MAAEEMLELLRPARAVVAAAGTGDVVVDREAVVGAGGAIRAGGGGRAGDGRSSEREAGPAAAAVVHYFRLSLQRRRMKSSRLFQGNRWGLRGARP